MCLRFQNVWRSFLNQFYVLLQETLVMAGERIWKMVAICNKFRMNKKLLFALSVSFFVSCVEKTAEISDGNPSGQITLYALSESEPEVRNTIDNNTLKTTWTAGDAINVFFGASESSRFVTSQSGEVAQFKGSIDVVTGGGEGLTDDTSLWGIYPYDSRNTCDGSTVTLSLPAVQEAAENTFAVGLFPQIARSWNFYMTFYNLCGCIRFTVTNSDIRYVTLSGNNGEAVAGQARISMEGTPAVEDILSSETKLTMSAPDGGYFKPGIDYYFVLYPTSFPKGLTITYYKDTSVASYVHPNAYTLTRNKVVRFKNRDSGLTFENIPLNDWENGDNIEDEI